MHLTPQILEGIEQAVRKDRLLDTAIRMIAVPSPTRNAGNAAHVVAAILTEDGFEVERPPCGWEESPGVVTRLESGKPGKTLQFNGHLDTVHLPFAPPAVNGDLLTGSGACDMKAGTAA